jgi:hypothetical protein
MMYSGFAGLILRLLVAAFGLAALPALPKILQLPFRDAKARSRLTTGLSRTNKPLKQTSNHNTATEGKQHESACPQRRKRNTIKTTNIYVR